ncbi:MAG: signal peptide peptidase SppA [Phocaeicola sp.]
MKSFLKLTLASVVGLIIFSALSTCVGIGILGAVASMGDTPTVLKPNSIYTIELSGTLVERSDEDPFAMAIAKAMGDEGAQSLGLDDLLSNIKKAKEDSNILGIYLKGGDLQAGYASMKELRDALADFKRSGKFIVAYADSYNQSNYYLSSVADKVLLNAQGMLDWRGLYTMNQFYKNTLEKVGVEMQVVKVGTFKSAVEPFINTQMSDANRLQMNTLLTDVWNSMLEEVAATRHIEVSLLNQYADQNMLFQEVEKYKSYGFVDSLVYALELNDILKTLAQVDTISKVNKVTHSAMCKFTPAKESLKEKVAVIYAVGEITQEGGEGIVGKEFVKTIDKATHDKEVKAVVLRVNSPGGSAYASEQIWDALVRLKAQKPLIVSMGNYAASGGYYISCMADSIVAQPNTITGSIGIFGLIPNVSKLMGKIGVTFDGVQTNKMSNMESDMVLSGLDTEEKLLMQGYVNRGYELFVKRCAEGRGMSVDAIKAIAEGRVWTGNAAIENGLVDELGSLNDAIAMAAEKANLTTYDVSEYPAKKDFATKLMESLDLAVLADKVAASYLGEQYSLFKDVKEAQELKGIQAIMPVQVVIK